MENRVTATTQDQTEKAQFIIAFSAFGIISLFFFGVTYLFQGKVTAGLFEILGAIIAFVNALALRWHRRTDVAGGVILLIMSVVLSFLLLTGGIEQTGLFWYATFPALALFLIGKKWGLVWVVLLCCLTLILFGLGTMQILPGVFSWVTIRQLLISQGVVTGILYFYADIMERVTALAREQSKDLETANRKLQEDAEVQRQAQEVSEKNLSELEQTKIGMLNVLEDLSHEKRHLEEKERELLEAQRIGRFGIFLWDLSTNRTEWSDELFHLYGIVPPADHQSPSIEHHLTLIHPQDREQARSVATLVTQDEEEHENTHRVQWPDGSIHWISAKIKRVRAEDGHGAIVRGTFQDVTFEKTEELRIEHDRKKNDALINSIGEGLTATDGEGKVVLLNDAFQHILGWSKEEIMGKKLSDFVPILDASGKTLSETERPMGKVLETGEKVVATDLFYVKKDGTKVPIALTTTPVYFEGSITGIIAVFRDISKEIAVQSQITEQNKLLARQATDLSKFKQAVDASRDMIVITDADGIVLYANNATEEITGFTLSEALHRKAGVLWGNLMEKPFYARMWETIKGQKQVYVDEITNHRKNGEKYTGKLSVYPILDEKGEVLFFVGVQVDITKEKEVDRMKTEFISLASHQLRTPLTAIKWFSEMMLDEKDKLDSEMLENIHNINASNERMIELVNSLLNISRIESGRMIIEPVPTDLGELVNGIMTELKPRVDAKKQHVIISIHPSLPKISIDPKMIRQVYMNFLTNSIKYTPEGGEISVFVSVKDQDVISQVSDTGYGIPKKEQSRVFGKFYRGENVIPIETDGNGLGLYLVKSIIETSGGKVWFESEEGKGTTFWFSLPMSGTLARKGEVRIDA